MLYAIEYQEDNHKELCDILGASANHNHYVRANALTYHYKFDGTPSEITLDLYYN